MLAVPSLPTLDWKVWDFEQPYGASPSGPALPCRWSLLDPPRTRGLRAPWNSSVCLRPPGDLLSDALARDGHWAECDDLPQLYAIGAARSEHPGRAAVLDVGMNLGACALHLLLATDAQVFSFEPGLSNLAYATTSLLALASTHQSVRHRSRVFPIGLGDANLSAWLHPAQGNAGHSVLGSSSSVDPRLAQFDPSSKFGNPEAVIVRIGDSVLWPEAYRRGGHAEYRRGAPGVAHSGDHQLSSGGDPRPLPLHPPPVFALLKLDVEGFECSALRGMRILLGAGAIQTAKMEVYDDALRAQGCSGVELQRLLSASGFRLFLTAHALDTTRCSPPPASLLGRVSPFRRHRALSPDVLHGRPHLPYNLYAIHCKEGADA